MAEDGLLKNDSLISVQVNISHDLSFLYSSPPLYSDINRIISIEDIS